MVFTVCQSTHLGVNSKKWKRAKHTAIPWSQFKRFHVGFKQGLFPWVLGTRHRLLVCHYFVQTRRLWLGSPMPVLGSSCFFLFWRHRLKIKLLKIRVTWQGTIISGKTPRHTIRPQWRHSRPASQTATNWWSLFRLWLVLELSANMEWRSYEVTLNYLCVVNDLQDLINSYQEDRASNQAKVQIAIWLHRRFKLVCAFAQSDDSLSFLPA